MQFYPENYIINVTVPFTDPNGATVTPTAVSAALYDGEDVLVQDLGVLAFAPGATAIVVTIAAQFNQLGVDEIRAARILRAALTTTAGIVEKTLSYVIEGEQRLVLMNNTFQSLEAAEIQALDYPNASGWISATDDQKRSALVEAFKRITAIPMRVTPRDPTTGELLENEEWFIDRDEWLEHNDASFATFPTHFKRALRRAQFIEANELLASDVMGRKRRQGIISETIGESSVRLSGNMVDYGIATPSMQALAGYLYFNNRIARA